MTTSFLAAALPPEGPYCILSIQGRAGARAQTFHPDLVSVGQRVQALALQKLNAYIGLASFTPGVPKREAANARTLRSFFLDLDCGENKPHATPDLACAALRSFLTDTGLPDPWVIHSGNGVHVYWTLEEELRRDDWVQIAHALKRLCLSRKLGIDPTVTADAARVMRIPGTFNSKGDVPLLCEVISSAASVSSKTFYGLINHCLRADDDAAPGVPETLTGSGTDELTRQLAGGDYPTASFRRLASRSLKGTGCAQIAHALNEAETLEEPLWRAALSIAWRCTDGEEAVHKISSPHPDYDPDETIAKAQATKGPMTCKWYRDNHPALCQDCQQKVTSPIVLGHKVEAAKAVNGTYTAMDVVHLSATSTTPKPVSIEIPEYPRPYFRGSGGGVYKQHRNKNDEIIETEVYRYDLYPTARFYDLDDVGVGEGEMIGLNLHTPNDGVRSVVTPVATVLSPDKGRDFLLKHGVFGTKDELGDIMAYLATSIKSLQKSFSAARTRNQMGWTSDLSGFVLGEFEYTADKILLAPAGPSTKALAPHLRPEGTLDRWCEVVRIYELPGFEAHAMTVLFGFGSVLLRLADGLDVRGAIINLMSNRSGTGKTTAQHIVNSIWGHPQHLLLAQKDTILSKMQYMGLMNNLPVTMDEITNMSDEQLSDFIYDVPVGRGRNRMESQSNRLRVNTVAWCTLVICSSNSSIYDKIARLKMAPDGEVRRVLEFQVNRPVDVPKAESDRLFSLLGSNYGVAGPVFLKQVLRNMEQIKALLRSTQIELDAKFKFSQADRHLSKIFATAFTAGVICKDLGLLNFDLDRLRTYAEGVINGIRTHVTDPFSDPKSIAQETLAAYIHENVSNTVVINAAGSSGMPPAPITIPRGQLKMRYEPDTNELWISTADFRKFLVDRQVSVREALAGLTSQGFLKHDGVGRPKRLGSGVLGGFDSVSMRCYCFDGKAMGLMANDFDGVQPEPGK